MMLGALTRVKLRTKLQVAFFVLVVLSTGAAGWQAFNIARESIERMTFDRLTSIREIKKREIETYVRQLRSEATAIAEDGRTVEAARFFRGGAVSAAMRARYDEVFRRLCVHFEYDDILLIDPEGIELYSTKAGGRSGSGDAADACSRALSRMRRDARLAAAGGTLLGDFELQDDSSLAPSAFIAAPVFDGAEKIAVLFLNITPAHINRVMTGDRNWERDGLGKTGESYIVGEDATMRTDSRFFFEDAGSYFEVMKKRGASAELLARMQRQHTSILLQEARTEATADALAGRTDTRILNDYRGVPVLSSWAPLDIPDVRWVILAEIDMSEAFASVYALRERILMLSLFILLFAAILAFVISQTVTRPIQLLAAVTERFGRGDLNGRAVVQAQDEVGELASAFNRMAENTMQHTVQLRSEIASRTRAEEELLASREQLRNLSRHLQSVREEERKGVAREIHDELGQALTAIKLTLALMKQDASALPAGATGQIAMLMRQIDDTLRSVKRIITELRPGLLDDLGLYAAIEWQAGEFQSRTGIRCILSLPEDERTVDQELATTLFRIFQETLTNVARHAGATEVRVALSFSNDGLDMTIADNGRGITEKELRDPGSFGLLGMRERALYCGGTVDITGRAGEGSTVRVSIPLPQGDRRS
jgi:signal transduction histidine kinase